MLINSTYLISSSFINPAAPADSVPILTQRLPLPLIHYDDEIPHLITINNLKEFNKKAA